MSAFDKYHDLYLEAKAAKAEVDERIARRYAIYFGSKQALSFSSGGRQYSKKDLIPLRRMTFELIEAQIDTSIPLAKVTPRYQEDSLLAAELEEFLNIQADALNSEDINDEAEREVRIQGTGIYYIDWDTSAGNVRRRGDLRVEFIKLRDFYPQPNINKAQDLEYVFVHSTTTVDKVKQIYGKIVEADNGTKTSVDLVICWYLNDEGNVSKLVWTRQRLEVLYDMPNYYSRKERVCAVCATPWTGERCDNCGSKESKYIDNDTFVLHEDLYMANGDQEPEVYIPKGTQIQNYKIKSLPFVIRKNFSTAGGGLFGVSEAELLEETQDANNKILNKISENVLAGGTIVTLPSNTTIDNAAGSLKRVRITDPRQKALVGAYPIQANVQQDDIVQDRLYQIGRQSVGITDAYQGKRDPTAESGKAKEISAMQTAGRLESKYVSKTTAYSEMYQKMFYLLLAFSDEPRRMIKPYLGVDVEEAVFSKYNFAVEYNGKYYLNDDFIFSTNGSYILSNRKEALWQTTTQAFMSGGFGNPQDPRVVLMYWNLMNRYDYPLAGKVLQILESNTTRLPPELEQALLANPELIEQLMALLQAKGEMQVAKNKEMSEEARALIDPKADPTGILPQGGKKPDEIKGE